MIIALGGLIGTCLGSFVSLLADRYRQTKWQDILWKRSACTACEHSLAFFDLIPVVSWIFLQGKCRHCQQPIGLHHPLLEITAGITVSLSFSINTPLNASLMSMLVLLAIYMARVDWRLRVIPIPSLILMAALGITWMFTHPFSFWSSILLGLIGLACQQGYLWFRGRPGLGSGDVILLSICGLFLTLEQIPFFLILTGLIGAILGLVWLKLYNKRYFPLTPAILSALLLGLFYSF
jgi:prepilin signal peptidase PulO-like enzyme (type II secretory pathway)